MADDTTGRDSDKFMLRLPSGMRDRLKALAESNKRSMNAEIVARLQTTLGDSDELPTFAPQMLYTVAQAAAESTTTHLLELFATFVEQDERVGTSKQIENLRKFISDRYEARMARAEKDGPLSSDGSPNP